MNLDTLFAEIEADFISYKQAGLIDRSSMTRWAHVGLKRFGQSITELTETTVEIYNGQAQLPKNFHSLQLAAKCDLTSYFCKEEDRKVIQNTLMWKERIERKTTALSCTPCCTDTTEKVITENIIINDRVVSFYYSAPT